MRDTDREGEGGRGRGRGVVAGLCVGKCKRAGGTSGIAARRWWGLRGCLVNFGAFWPRGRHGRQYHGHASVAMCAGHPTPRWGGFRGQKKVCVPKIRLKFPASLVNFIPPPPRGKIF